MSEFKVVADTGQVPLALFEALLMVRAGAAGHTQDIEGMNSLIQLLGKRAPNLKHPHANARLILMKSEARLSHNWSDACDGTIPNAIVYCNGRYKCYVHVVLLASVNSG